MNEKNDNAIDAAAEVLVFALTKALPVRFYPSPEEECREAAESIVRMMYAPGDGPEEKWRRNFATLFAQMMLTERSEQAPQFRPTPRPEPPSTSRPRHRPASFLDGSEDAIRKMLSRGYTYRGIAERYRVSEQAVKRHAKEHELRRPREKLAGREKEVCQLLGRKLTQRTIAKKLRVSQPTLSQFIHRHQLKPA
jgi:DNA-binding NarL/FixJ family response regulator